MSSDSLRNEASVRAADREADLRAELAEAENRRRTSTEALSAERACSKTAQAVAGRARQAAERDRGDEARGRVHLGDRAHGERGAARAHQRRRRRGRAPHQRAGRPGLADRDHPRGRRRTAGAAGAGGGQPPPRPTSATAKAPAARSPTASARCKAAPRSVPQPSRPDSADSATTAAERRTAVRRGAQDAAALDYSRRLP